MYWRRSSFASRRSASRLARLEIADTPARLLHALYTAGRVVLEIAPGHRARADVLERPQFLVEGASADRPDAVGRPGLDGSPLGDAPGAELHQQVHVAELVAAGPPTGHAARAKAARGGARL